VMKPLRSIHLDTKAAVEASVERSDVCAVPSGGVVAEAVCALVIANALLDKFGGDTVTEIKRNCEAYLNGLD